MATFDSDLFQKINTFQQQQRTAFSQVDPTVAASLADYHNRYPWMAPDAKWSLAKAGIDPTDPTAQTAAAAAAHLEVNNGLGFAPIGSPVTRPAAPPDTTDVFTRLEQLRNQHTGAPLPALQQPAGQSPMQQIIGDNWKNLRPPVQALLAGVTFEQDDQFKQKLGLRSDQVLYKLGGTFSSLSYDLKKLVEDTVAKYGDANKMDASVDYISPNGGTVKGSGASEYASPDSTPYVSVSQPVKFDKPALQLGGYDIGDLGPVMPIIRTGMMVLSAPHQELTGAFRDLYDLAQSVHEGHPSLPDIGSQSDLGVAIGDLVHGRPVDTGSGFFVNPQSPVAQERFRREAAHGVYANGEPITLGRSFANDVLMLQPGSKPAMLLSGLVDASSAIAADPTVWGLKAFSSVRETKNLLGAENSATRAVQAWKDTGQVTAGLRAFQDAGGLAGLHPTITPAGVNAWLDAPERLPTLQKIADTASPRTIWEGLNRQVDPAVAAQLADANTPADVAQVLRSHLGTEVRTPFGVSDFGSSRPFNLGLSSDPQAILKTPNRWAAMMPHSQVDGTSLQANAVELTRAASLLKAPPDQLESWFNDMARTTEPFQRQQVWQQVMDDTAERLLGKGVPASRANQLTRMAQARQAADSTYAVQEVAGGRGSVTGTPVIDGTPSIIKDSQPLMLSQTLNGDIPLPDFRALRRALSSKPVQAVLQNPLLTWRSKANLAAAGYEGVPETALYNLQKVWKGLQISTVKTMLKVLGDEQFAIGSRGYTSMFTHPIDAASIILGTPQAELPEDAGYLARLRDASAGAVRWGAGKLPGVEPSLTTTVEGHSFDDLQKLQQVASHGIDASVSDPGVLHANNWQVLEHNPGVNDAEFLDAHARHLAQFAASPDTRGFVKAGSLQQAQDWYWDGPGAEYRRLLATDSAYQDTGLDVSRAVSDEHVAKVLNQIQTVTNGNPDLVNAIASGRLGDTAVFNTVRDGTPRVSQNFVNKLGDYTADLPNVTIQQKALYSKDLARKQLADQFFSRMIHTLLGTPSAVLSKSPLFRQAYWERIADTAPFMTPDAQAAAVRIAENEARLTPDLLNELKQKIAFGNRTSVPFSGTLELDQADQLAQNHALNVVQQTTHEFSDRSQAFDMLRLLTPFGEVWRKTIKRWASIVNQNPAVVERFRQGFEALRSPDLGAFMGEPAGQGFFHTDQNGQEVFTVPGSEWATQALTGVPVPLVGNVKGLSLGTEFFPAFGPVASIPVAWTMSKLNVPMPVQETIFPYGAPKNYGDLVNYLPSWAQKAFGQDRPTSPDSVRTFNNTVIDYLRYGLTNGDYHLDTPAGIQQAMEDATNKAHTLYWIRGAAQFFVPGAPSPQMLVRDKTGRLIDAGLLVQDFKKLQDQDPNTAGQKFLDMYGPDIFRSMTSKSYAYTFGIPTSADSAAWVDDHSSVKRDFPHIYGYFAPPSDPNQFDYNIYLQQLQPGQGRAPLSPEQWAKVANARLAALQYGTALDKVDKINNGKPPDANQRAWLSAKKRQLMAQYPGYEESLYGGNGLPARSDPKLLTDEAAAAAKDPTVQSTDAGQGLVAYMAKQKLVDDEWTKAGFAAGTWQTSAGDYAISLRNWMRQQAAKVEAQHPQFGPLFEDVFGRAMRDDTNPNALTPGG